MMIILQGKRERERERERERVWGGRFKDFQREKIWDFCIKILYFLIRISTFLFDFIY